MCVPQPTQMDIVREEIGYRDSANLKMLKKSLIFSSSKFKTTNQQTDMRVHWEAILQIMYVT